MSQIAYFKEAILIHKEAIDFIKKHQLWQGFRRAGWAWKISVIAAISVSIRFLQMIYEWLGLIGSTSENMSVFQGALGFWEGMSDFGKDLVQSSGLRYLMLLFIEVLIFHFAVKTLNILENEDRVPGFKDFIRAEIRMFKVIVRSWFLELVLAALISLALGLLGLSFLKIIFIFGVQCYFLGFAYIDNYNEQYDLKINRSAKVIREFYGAAIGFGLVNYILFLIPIFGPLIAPFMGAVASSLFMYKYAKPTNKRHILDLV